MRRNTPGQAYDRYARALQAVVGCVTEARLTLNDNRAIELDTIYAIVLKSRDGVVVASKHGGIQFDLGQRFRIIRDPEARQGPYRATTVEYWYRPARQDGPALLSFPWPDQRHGGSSVTRVVRVIRASSPATSNSGHEAGASLVTMTG